MFIRGSRKRYPDYTANGGGGTAVEFRCSHGRQGAGQGNVLSEAARQRTKNTGGRLEHRVAAKHKRGSHHWKLFVKAWKNMVRTAKPRCSGSLAGRYGPKAVGPKQRRRCCIVTSPKASSGLPAFPSTGSSHLPYVPNVPYKRPPPPLLPTSSRPPILVLFVPFTSLIKILALSLPPRLPIQPARSHVTPPPFFCFPDSVSALGHDSRASPVRSPRFPPRNPF